MRGPPEEGAASKALLQYSIRRLDKCLIGTGREYELCPIRGARLDRKAKSQEKGIVG